MHHRLRKRVTPKQLLGGAIKKGEHKQNEAGLDSSWEELLVVN
jgi:hypothetical protein